MADKKSVRYTKSEILASSGYAEFRDIVSALLEEKTEYTLKQVDEMINQFRKGTVN